MTTLLKQTSKESAELLNATQPIFDLIYLIKLN